MNKKAIFVLIVVLALLSHTASGQEQVSAQTPKQDFDGWIVTYDSSINRASLGLEAFGEVRHYAKGKNFPYSFSVVRSLPGKRPATDLASVRGVKHVEPNWIVHVDTTANDPMYVNGQQWYLGPSATNMEAAWPTSTTETIGIIDTGCAQHVDLPTIPASDRFTVISGTVTSGVADDLYGHGTWNQGIIEAKSDNSIGIAGIIWNPSRFVCIKIRDDIMGIERLSDAAYGVQLARDQGVLFLGADFAGGENINDQTLRDSVSYFLQGGGYLFAACGNEGAPQCDYPANYSTTMEGVIATSGVSQTLTLASFSNYGSAVTFTEPAVDICSTALNNTYECHNGTSGATPIALAIAAASHNLNALPRTAFLQFLKSKAVDLGTPGFDNSFGWGMLTSKALEVKKYYLPIMFR